MTRHERARSEAHRIPILPGLPGAREPYIPRTVLLERYADYATMIVLQNERHFGMEPDNV